MSVIQEHAVEASVSRSVSLSVGALLLLGRAWSGMEA